MAGARGGRGHAAIGRAQFGDLAVLDAQPEGADHGRDVLIETLRQFVGREARAGLEQRNRNLLDDLVLRERGLAIGEDEIVRLHLSRAAFRAQRNRRIERHQAGNGVADRRGIGDIGGERADIADLARADPAHELGERREVLVEEWQRARVGDAAADRQRVRAFRDRAQRGRPIGLRSRLETPRALSKRGCRDRCRRQARWRRDISLSLRPVRRGFAARDKAASRR